MNGEELGAGDRVAQTSMFQKPQEGLESRCRDAWICALSGCFLVLSVLVYKLVGEP